MKLTLHFIATLLALTTLMPGLLAQPKNNYLKDVNLPTPNAAALGKYGDIPVSYFTGVPSISIPIHTLQEGPLSLPVSLNYHASGLKVAETASWVGAGWSLDAGGMISRTVLGLSDEQAGVGYFANGANLLYTSSNVKEVADGKIDSEPDLFNFNIMGYSGKFYYDPKATTTNKWTTVPKQDIVIEHDPVNLNFFKITTPDGVIYTFGVLEISNPGTIKTGWYLTKIESPDKKYAINLTYEAENFAYRSLASTAYYVAGMELPGSFCSNPVYTDPSPLQFNNSKYYKTEIRSYRLTSITTSTETLQFNATTSREDLELYQLTTPKRLDEIMLNAGGSSFCKRWAFDYDYFVDPSCSDPHCKKLKLLQLTERSCGTTNIQAKEPYKFEYEGALVMVNGQNKQALPNRLSKAIDHWGYSNGATGNDLLRVSVPPTTLYNDILGKVTFGAANRNTNEASMRQGVLKKITYPTGGNTAFTFEANEGVETKPVTSPQYIIPLTSNCSDLGLCCNSPQKVFTYTFTSADLADLSKVFFTLEMVDMSCTNNPNCISGPRSVMIEVRNSTTDAFLGRYNFNLGATEYEKSMTENLKKLYSGFVPGTYKFVLCAAGGQGTFSVFRPITTTQNAITKVGGLRIKEIRSHDGISASNDVVKTYQYLDESTNQSSGKLLIETPQYGYSLFTADGTQKQYLCYFQDASVVPLGDYSGYHIGYQRVVEALPGNGKNVYVYQTETFTPSYDFPNVPDPATVQRGQLLMSSTYHENAQLLDQTINTVAADAYASSNATVFKTQTTATCSGASFIASQTYTPRTAPYRLAMQSSNKDGVSALTTYAYASSGHLAPIGISTTNSNGKTSVQDIAYAQEMITRNPASAGVYTDMKNRNMITIPIEQTESVAGVVVGGSRSEYGLFNGAGSNVATAGAGIFPYPYKFWNYEMTWNLSNQVATTPSPGWVLKGTIDAYHPDIKPSTANTPNPARAYPKQFTQAGWSPETYEWENGLLTKKCYLQQTQSFSFYPNTRLLWTSVSVDGQTTTYIYDNLWRLQTLSNRNNNVVTNYTYGFKNASNAYNFVKTLTTYTPVSGSKFKEKGMLQYFDGLGRPVQDLKLKHQPEDGSNDQKLPTNDVAVAYQYDNQGRLRSTSNPYLSTKQDGSFVTVPTNWPSVSLQYEPSPLGRVSSSISQLGYVTQTSYGRNLSAIASPDGTSYPANSLYETKVTDPDNRVGITYTDKRGRVVLSRNTNTSNTSPADTYTVYDNKDRVTEVYPPASTSSTPELIFRYRYDGANNLTYKKVPDAAAMQYRYDTRDLPAYLQDGNLAAQSKCLKTQYDLYGRAIKTGFWNGFPTTVNLTDTFAINDANLLTKTFYDGIGTGAAKTEAQYRGRVRRSEVKVLDGAATPVWLHTSYEYDTHGRLINSVGNNYLNPSIATAETTSSSYDYGDNVYYENRNHSPAGVATPALSLQNSYVVDPNGRRNGIVFNANGTAIQIAEYNYNFLDELIERNLHANLIGSAWGWLQSVDYSYNTQGWLTGINHWQTTPSPVALPATCAPTMPNVLNTPTRSTFNEDSDLMYMDIRYDQLFGGVAGSTQKAGNIAQIASRVRGRETQILSYAYDHLSRLNSSTFYEYSDAAVTSNTNKYNESLSYDLRGNILTLQRNGAYTTATPTCDFGQIDNLTYSYTPNTNKVHKILDNASGLGDAKSRGFNGNLSIVDNAMAYDANGNLNKNLHKNISSISYNHLNLPTLITFSTGGSIEFIYDAAGTKLRKTVKQGTTIQYVQDYLPGGIEYRQNGTGLKYLEAVYHPEGRYYNTNVGSSNILAWRAEYNLRDHLGNTRLVFTDKTGTGTPGVIDVRSNTAANEILQENHYYTFGMAYEGNWLMNDAGVRDNAYQYNGKEINADFGLNWNDYGARWYDPAIGRWNSVDPVAEKMRMWSPYSYAFDNPMKFIDPNGMEPDCPPGVDCGDPVPNPRISRDNRNEENSNRFNSPRLRKDGTTRLHRGLDVLAKKGDHINSVMDGEIVGIKTSLSDGEKTDQALGNYVTVRTTTKNGDVINVTYGHLSPDTENLELEVGQKVKIGDQIGVAGYTGNAAVLKPKNRHVHMQVKENGQLRDPEVYMKTEFDADGKALPKIIFNPRQFKYQWN
jgi:RHS repeat-associated protein